MNGMRGYLGWRWVFILEGTLTAVVAIGCFFLIPDFPVSRPRSITLMQNAKTTAGALEVALRGGARLRKSPAAR